MKKFFSKSERTIIYNVLRQFIYFCLISVFILLMYALANDYHDQTFAEGGIVENIQLGLLIASGFIFLLQLRLRPEYACVLWLLASCSFLAAARELDMLLDEYLPIISWRIGFVFPLIAFYGAWLYRSRLKKTLIRFFTSPSFYMMCCAMVIIIPIAQCIGHRSFIVNILGIKDVAAIKELFEEACEAMGYFLIFVSSIECYFSLPKTVKIKYKGK